MTYLQLVNKVLRRLREKAVTTISQNDYSTLVGDFVNEAKEAVEDSWQWKALRTDITFDTEIGVTDYDLGAGGVGSDETDERSELLYDLNDMPQVYDLDNNCQLSEVPLEEIRSEQVITQADTTPSRFAQVRTRTGITLRIYPAPNAVRSMQASFKVPQDELTAASPNVNVSVPASPVWKLALALAVEERGEGLGLSATKLFDRANKALGDAKLRDMETPDLTVRAV